MAKIVDLRTYLLLERAFVRRLQRSWRALSAPTYAAIAQACKDHRWDEARRLVTDLDMTEVGTENREWITYMLLSCAVFGAGMAARKKPSFVGVGSFDTFLKQVTNNFLMYLEHGGTQAVQEEALQSIAEDEAKTKALKWDEHKHPRDKEGQFTEAGFIEGRRDTDLMEGGHGPERAKWEKLNRAVMEADDVSYTARRAHVDIAARLEEKYPAGTEYTDYENDDFKEYYDSRNKALEAGQALDRRRSGSESARALDEGGGCPQRRHERGRAHGDRSLHHLRRASRAPRISGGKQDVL